MQKMPKLFAALLLVLSFTASAKESSSRGLDFRACPQFFAASAAPRVPNAQLLAPRALCYDSFAVLHSGVSKTPVFVAERLNRAHLNDAKDEKRTNRFFADARLPDAERAQLSDYRRSGYDRGHMAPAANMPTARAMAQSFSLANMVPQSRINNQRSWAGIEKATRHYVMRARGDVYVITGPVFGSRPETIGPGKVWVPTYLYKLVYDASSGRAWAHWIENSDTARAGPPISYEELVRRTRIEFLPGLQLKSRPLSSSFDNWRPFLPETRSPVDAAYCFRDA